MSASGRARLARDASVLVGLWVRERATGAHPAPPGACPPNTDVLTEEWLTRALCRGIPGAAVIGFCVGQGSDGTSARRPLSVTYNAAGQAAGLPQEMYTKSSPNLMSRLMCGINQMALNETEFYLRIRPELDIECPVAYDGVYDTARGTSLLLLEDISQSRGVTFADPTKTRVDRNQAEEMVRLMANYHGTYWDSPRLDTEFTWLVDAADWQRQLNDLMGFRRMFNNGVKRSQGFMPPAMRAREAELWPALMRSLDTDADKPSTLLHQDTHSRNWYFTGDGHMGLYDWQATGKGPWAIDVSYALACGLEIEDRREWEREPDRLLRRRAGRAHPVPGTPAHLRRGVAVLPPAAHSRPRLLVRDDREDDAAARSPAARGVRSEHQAPLAGVRRCQIV